MDGRDQDRERTFRADFSKEGVTKLAERLTDRLNEYMGDFVDDTLVVIFRLMINFVLTY